LAERGIRPKFACLLIEKKASSFAKLESFAKLNHTPEFSIQAQNWDFAERLTDIVSYCRTASAFPFIFIDPKGWQLAGISKIWPLLRLNPGEVLINLMSSFIGRFIKDNTTDFSDLLGADFPALRALSGEELESAIVEKYCEMVKREGRFNYVCSLPVMNPDMDSFSFHLIYATRHIKGVKVFKDVENQTEKKTHSIRAELQQRSRQSKSGNFELFPPNVQYRENCYRRLERTNKERARETVRALIESSPVVSYDACWNEALQFSAVYEKDLREWVGAWESQGLLTVEGKAPRARVLQVGEGVNLIRVVRN